MRLTLSFLVCFAATFVGCTQPAPVATSSTSVAANTCSDGAPECGPKAAASSPSAAAPSAAPPPSSASTPAVAAPSIDSPGKWTFDADRVDAAPVGFSFGRTNDGPPGRWIVQAASDAPSGSNVLAQTDTDATDMRFPIAVADGLSLRDVRLSVRCKPISGKVDQACGLVFRYKDENNYYVTRANALEGNVRLYHVKDGRRKQFASWSGEVKGAAWHELRVDARGEQLEVYFDSAKIIDANDKTFPDAGKVGVWTKADSVTYFDDLNATSL